MKSMDRSIGNFDRTSYISEEAPNKWKRWIENIFDPGATIKFPPIDYIIFIVQNWKAGDAHIK